MTTTRHQKLAQRAAELDQDRVDNDLLNLAIIIEEAMNMMKGGWAYDEMERCTAVLYGGAALAREVRQKLGRGNQSA